MRAPHRPRISEKPKNNIPNPPVQIHMMRLFSRLLIILVAASWVLPSLAGEAHLGDLVRSSHVIVEGHITQIRRARGTPTYGYDTAIVSGRILRGRGLLKTIYGEETRAPLSFPSVNNRRRIDTDIRYEVGQQGIWLLVFHNGRLWGKQVGSLQPLSKREEIERLMVGGPREHPLPRSVTMPKINRTPPF